MKAKQLAGWSPPTALLSEGTSRRLLLAGVSWKQLLPAALGRRNNATLFRRARRESGAKPYTELL
jgi:hypothetical protein